METCHLFIVFVDRIVKSALDLQNVSLKQKRAMIIDKETMPATPIKTTWYVARVGDDVVLTDSRIYPMLGALTAVRLRLMELFRLRPTARYGFLNCSAMAAKLMLDPAAPQPRPKKPIQRTMRLWAKMIVNKEAVATSASDMKIGFRFWMISDTQPTKGQQSA